MYLGALTLQWRMRHFHCLLCVRGQMQIWPAKWGRQLDFSLLQISLQTPLILCDHHQHTAAWLAASLLAPSPTPFDSPRSCYSFFLAEIFVQSIRESIGIGGGVRWLSWVVINVSLTLCEGRHLSLSLSASILYEMSCGSPRAKCRLLRSRASIYTTLYIFHWRLQPQPQPPTNHCAKLFLLLWSPSPLDAS